MSELTTRLIDDPLQFADCSYYDCFQLPLDELESIHLEGARRRFEQLHDRVPALRKLAAEQGIARIGSLDDVVPLLFPHTVYKSYPLSYLEKGRYDKLTRW
ncbi:MAG: hypothetical protein JRH19_07375, partial [Deltaproteobacteria bacterium]|nr:hypothetical protein [Deltaproteobacteria bacterium]